jgi:hypothetical protein
VQPACCFEAWAACNSIDKIFIKKAKQKPGSGETGFGFVDLYYPLWVISIEFHHSWFRL